MRKLKKKNDKNLKDIMKTWNQQGENEEAVIKHWTDLKKVHKYNMEHLQNEIESNSISYPRKREWSGENAGRQLKQKKTQRETSINTKRRPETQKRKQIKNRIRKLKKIRPIQKGRGKQFVKSCKWKWHCLSKKTSGLEEWKQILKGDNQELIGWRNPKNGIIQKEKIVLQRQ